MKALIKKILPPPALSFARDNARKLAGLCGNKIPKDAQIFGDITGQIFFGYYDVTPFSKDGTILLAMRAPAQNTSPHGKHPELEIGYFNLGESKKFQRLGSTTTWNWQQGCRLQWLDDESVIYNTGQGAVVQNIRSRTITRKFPLPVYALDRHRHFALTLDFSKLHQNRRGYGYSNINSSIEGITRIDLRSGETQEIVGAGEFGTGHYLNHLSFNPSGTRFMAFDIAGKDSSRSIQLVTANTDGSGFYRLNPEIKPSHYCWMDDENLLITGVYQGKMVYVTMQDKTQNFEIVKSPQLNEDGHPSLLHDGAILSDTYPDVLGRQKLFLYHPESDKKQTLGSFYSPLKFSGEVRCDLHPRLSPQQNKIAVDIVHKGRRALCVIPMRRV